MLTKNELADRIAATGAGGRQQVKRILDALGDVVAEEISAGNSVSVPGVAALKFRYTAARKKGELYRKGEEKTGFGGNKEIAEEDSKARKEKIDLKADLAPNLKRLKKDSTVMSRGKRKHKK